MKKKGLRKVTNKKSTSEKITITTDENTVDISSKEYQDVYENIPSEYEYLKNQFPKPKIKDKIDNIDKNLSNIEENTISMNNNCDENDHDINNIINNSTHKKDEEINKNNINDYQNIPAKKDNMFNLNNYDINNEEEKEENNNNNIIHYQNIQDKRENIININGNNINNNTENEQLSNNKENIYHKMDNIISPNAEQLNNYNNQFYFNYNYYQLYQAHQNFYNMSIINYPNINNKLQTIDDISSLNLQNIYEGGTDSQREIIFNDLIGKFLKASIDKYKNYLVKLIIKEEGKKNHKEKIELIANELKGSFFLISKSNYGTCVVQTLIENIDEKGIKMIFDELISNENFDKLFYDKNGNHVLQNLIKKLNKEEIEQLIEKIINNFEEYCTKKYSCFVIQVLLEKCNADLIDKIINKIKHFELINDTFGIHIIQKLLDIYDKENNNFNIEFIYKDLNDLNIYNKIFNNKSVSCSVCLIIQSIFEKGNEEEKEKISKNLLKERENFILMFSNEFGNHVVQKIYYNSNDEIKNEIKNMLNEVHKQNKNMYFNHVKKYINEN